MPKEINVQIAKLLAEEDPLWSEGDKIVEQWQKLDQRRKEFSEGTPERAIADAEWEQVERALDELDIRMRTLAEQRQSLEQIKADKFRQIVYVDAPSTVDIHWMSTYIPEDHKSAVSEGLEGFRKLVGVRSLDGVQVGVLETAGRAYAHAGEIYLDPRRSKARVTVHELGHILEEADPEVRRKAHEFLDRRTAGEGFEWLGDQYDKREVTRRDKFADPYMGKYYSDGSTEIVSMGLEEMWSDPAKFAQTDADYFDFIYNLTRGQ
jgi:hypothetical protein